MPDELRLFGAFGIALVTAHAATPIAIAIAGRTGFYDHPVGPDKPVGLDYKHHTSPTPYLGGAAVISGFLAGGLAIAGALPRLWPIVVLTLGLWALGTIDDRRGVSAGAKLLAEALAAAALWDAGLGWSLFGSDAANLAVTVAWVIALVNAFNIIDTLDGVASTLAAVTAAATAMLALSRADVGLASLSLALCGACAGFLPYNVAKPARIFLGDGGTLPVGFLMAASIMALSPADGIGWPLLLAAVLLAGLPVVDTTLVVVSRVRRRLPLHRGSPHNINYRLIKRFPSARTVALTLGVVQAGLGAVAVGVVQLGRGSIMVAWSVWFVVAAASVALLETRAWAPETATVAATPRGARTSRGPREKRPRGFSVVEAVLVLFVSLALGLSPLLYGFYELAVWGPIALGMLAALFGLVVARPAVPRRSALVALAGLALLWLWALASTGWAESADQALVEANRWLLYAALFAILLLLLRDDRLGVLLVGAATVAVLGFAAYVVGALMSEHGPALFLGGRLHDPLGYANGNAAYLLLGFWPLVAAAERLRPRLLAGAAAAAATVLLGLVLLTQTRAVVPAVVLSLVLLVAVVPGRRVRAWALLVIFGGVAIAADPLLDVYRGARESSPAPEDLRRAVTFLLIGAAAAGAAWGASAWLASAVRRMTGTTQRRLASASGIALTVGTASVVAVMVGVIGNPVAKAKDEYRTFVELGSSKPGDSRFSSGGGNRYDYWRIAVRQFEDDPIRGIGAGNYDRTYYLERRSREDVRQPHSIELQTLGELGLVGGAALALFFGAVLAGALRRVREARRQRTQRLLTVAAGGMFVTWLVHTSVDWLHLIPGVTGIALCGAAVLVAPWARQRRRDGGWGRHVVVALAAIVVVLGAVFVGRSALAAHYRSESQEALASNPQVAVERANKALSLNDEALEAYYAKAAAYARLNRYRAARATLLEATRRERRDFVTWGLLGDLATRRGDIAAARTAYTRASQLNPRDRQLERLAQSPPAVR